MPALIFLFLLFAPLAALDFEPDYGYELDPYYSNGYMLLPLTEDPVPDMGRTDEFQVYRKLLYSSLVPRFLYMEVSVNPMPVAGVLIKKRARGFYDGMEAAEDLNLVQAVTAGFQEPYALSLFLGNVVLFSRDGQEESDNENKGFMGYLVSVGDHHIKDNELVSDFWSELEWKVKGDRTFFDHSLHWSFRVGAKLHGHPEIADTLYLALRRSHLDFAGEGNWFLHNSGFEYRIDMGTVSKAPVRQLLLMDKKFPMAWLRGAWKLEAGFLWEAAEKYSGSLREPGREDRWQVVFRPNIEF